MELSDIKKKLKNLIKKKGKTKELLLLKESLEQDELKDKFYHDLFLANYIKDKEKKKQLLKQAEELAEKIPDLKGWPKDKIKFWDVEALSWIRRMPREVRLLIRSELLKRIKLGGLNLSLGSGSYPYIEDSILLDISSEMLESIPTVKFEKKIIYDIEKGKLPFKDNSFDSATMVFVVDYLENLKDALKEIKRTLKKKGKLIIVQSKKPISRWFRMQERKFWTAKELERLLKSAGFKVEVDTKKIGKIELIFIEAVSK